MAAPELLFAHRLCLALKIEHPNRMTLTDEEFWDWIAFWELEPFGEEWRQTAILASIGASNGWFNGKHSWEKFMPVKPPLVRQDAAKIQRNIGQAFGELTRAAERQQPVKKKRRK